MEVGSILDYRYNWRYADKFAIAPRWIIQRDLYQRQASFKFIPFKHDLVLEHGEIGRGVAWTSYLPTGQPTEHETSASDTIDLNLTEVPAFLEEPFSPPGDSLKWRVYFFYRAARSKEEFWKQEGKFWSRDVENFLDRKQGVAEALSAVVAVSDTSEQKLKKIYAFVSKLENRGYGPSRGEKEEHSLGIEPNRGIEDVLRQKSGNHDDLNRLLAGMAREVGFQASMIRLPHRDRNIFDESFLGADQFDGEVAIVSVNGKDVYLDPGTKFCPYGLRDWRLSNSRGLRQSAGKGTEFGDTPLPDYSHAITTRLARLKLNLQGSVYGTMGIAFYDLEAMRLRVEMGRTDDAGRKKLLEERVKAWLPTGSDVELTKLSPWDDIETPLIAQFTVSSPLATGTGKRWVLPVHFFHVNEKPLFPASERTNPVYLYYPTRQIDEVHIVFPDNVEVDSLPPAASEKLAYAAYSTKRLQETKNSILAKRDLVMAGMAFPATMYKEIKAFYDHVKAGDDQQLLLKVSGRTAGN